MTKYNPAQEGIDAAIEDNKKLEDMKARKAFVSQICEEFKVLCVESVDEHSENFDDHLDYLKSRMDTFIFLKSGEE